MTEIWRSIPNYEGLYEISNFGRVKSLKRNIIRKAHPDGSGYLKIDLYKNNIQKTFKIHRLVAIVFIKNLEGYTQVNHIDGNILNNKVTNLEWCTPSENIKHKIYKLNKNSLHPCKKVKCVELNLIFPSITEGAKFLGIKQSSLSQSIKYNRKSGGFHWILL